MAKLFLATPFNIDDNWSAQFGTENTEPTMTQQSDAEDADINVIMKKYGPSGMFPQLTEPGIGGDFSLVTDYSSAIELIRKADEEFAQVPAQVRRLFNNSAAAYMAFSEKPENLDKMRELGMANKKPIPETTLADIAAILKEQANGQKAKAGGDPPG